MQRTWIDQTVEKIDQPVRLNGWVHRIRKMGDKLVFIDLRDGSGVAQIVFYKPDLDEITASIIDTLRPEYVVAVDGKVQKRGEKQINPDIQTGTIEIAATTLQILNTAITPPFEIDKDTILVNEELRLKYRYLDLRSERMARNIRMRDKIVQFFRDYMHRNRFIEIETPILMKGTPEGAREFVVPSRLHEGTFYVLPQSPQQFKQLCMVAGFERYFQIARCFRDEDQRGDRQPEFTQLDFEMSFVEREDILSYTEAMFITLVEELFPEKRISTRPFPRFTYAQSMEKFGSDKPDLRQDKNDPNELAFGWIVDFPMFERLEDGSIQAQHHPFCSIHPEDMEKLDSDPMSVRANAYDLFLNGFELSSGSIRIHEQALQKKIFDKLGISEEEQHDRFGHMLDAFTYGAPPHGGFAPGIDRIVMLLAGEPNIREVIPFPKTGDARDPMMGAPTPLEPKRLRDVHIKLDLET
ncbi:MAG: Aspartyl-tRNA synthetase [Candidatus Uhrbacteria bacterium GW2011_GWF2_39_13]|uniref:Aspartate--tRNA ligase n=1 Tax=Candidatus Uhrbacteria bacterium GW2011_GWF2_39_13 TaxID=1618995 RepID=A0A0G0QTH8_9BACT|nr:MAG: Aspartyl-tRNA synthetase [Candidatus Uhrbacteria bacterium GW2011_GWF2_39_13]HAU66127.1 aspartate--tRNA ligase [Candidatus Uhrbacteria bacterium]